jgi:hypothetical protein
MNTSSNKTSTNIKKSFSDKDLDIISPFIENDPSFSDISLILKRYLAHSLSTETDPVKIPTIVASIINLFDRDNKNEKSKVTEFRQELLQVLNNKKIPSKDKKNGNKHKAVKSNTNI